MFSQSCEFCTAPGSDNHGKDCCWTRTIEIVKFKRRVLNKYIIETIFDMVISVTSVTTDFVAIAIYIQKGKYEFALLTMIPVLLPTLVFTNVYLTDESPVKKKPVSKLTSINETREPPMNTKRKFSEGEFFDAGESVDTDSTDSNLHDLGDKRGCPCWTRLTNNWRNCCRGCFQCLCNRDHQLRRKGAEAVKNSLQKMFKYGFGTVVLRFIAWAWYIKALIFGIKAFREPKKFLKIATPENHWSYELLIRLDFLQAALENAPQCVIQLYALITQPDEGVALGMLTIIFSFIDFIRVSISIHWDMNKGPVAAPRGCYNTWIWKLMNTSSWMFLYSARACAIAFIFATSGITKVQTIFPAAVLAVHIIVFAKVLSKAEYGVAAQKIFVATFVSLFFLPELASSVMPAIIQFYYAMIIFQNAFFILPWQGFDQEYCLSSGSLIDKGKNRPTRPPPNSFDPDTTDDGVGITPPPYFSSTGARPRDIGYIPGPTTESLIDDDCAIDPIFITLLVPTITIIGVILRLTSFQRMLNYKNSLPSMTEEQDLAQNKLETSISNIFKKNWSQMSVNQMFTAFLRMLKKEVIIPNDVVDVEDEDGISTIGNKKMSFMSSRLQADFLASQTFIRESFSLMTRTTRSHDINIDCLKEGKSSDEGGDGEEVSPDYNSDSELTLRLKNLKKRGRLPRSRNVSENAEMAKAQMPSSDEISMIEVELPSGNQVLEMYWV